MSDSEKPETNPHREAASKPPAPDEQQQEEGLLDQIIAQTSAPQDQSQPASSRKRLGMFSALAALLLAAALLFYANSGRKAETRHPITVAPQISAKLRQFQPASSPLPALKLSALEQSAPVLTQRQPALQPLAPSGTRVGETRMYSGEQARERSRGEMSASRGDAGLKLASLAGSLAPPSLRRPTFQPRITVAELSQAMLSAGETAALRGDLTTQSPRETAAKIVLPETGKVLLRPMAPSLNPHSSQSASQALLQPGPEDVDQMRRPERFSRLIMAHAARDSAGERAAQRAYRIASLQARPVALSAFERALPAPELGDLSDRLLPVQPEGAEAYVAKAYMATLVGRLAQPLRTASPIRVSVQNLTYQDQGVESEGTKLLSGMLKQVTKRQERLDVLDPEDIASRTPQAFLKGSVWERPEAVGVRLQLVTSRTERALSTAELWIPGAQLPRDVPFAPPPGESLGPIERVVELMQQVFPKGGDFKLGVWPDKGVEAVYSEGDKLLVHVLSQSNAYLRVDYFQADGSVVHLLPNPLDNHFVEAGKTLVIGAPGSRFEFTVTPPFGEELLTVIASQNPLGERPEVMTVESATAYIERLSRKLKGQKTRGKVAGAHMIIVTKKR